MKFIETLDELHALYGTPATAATVKVAHRLTPEYAAWVERARFCILSTVGPDGTDGSPRGDVDPVVQIIDDGTLALPDWRGNQRLDSLRNIVRDPRISLMFMVPGSDTVIRLNGRAKVTNDNAIRDRFSKNGARPATVVLISISEVYTQCARALLRSEIWSGEDQSKGLPTVGQILSAMTKGAEGGVEYDRNWPKRAAKTLW